MLDVNKPIETFNGIALEWDGKALRRKDGGNIEWIDKYGHHQSYDLVFVSPEEEDLGWHSSGRPPFRNRAEPANNELAELRAFKEAAIARFPELAPVDPDLLEAQEVAEKFAWPRTDPQSPMWIGSASQMALAAIKRGRELERYAQGLTTPKD